VECARKGEHGCTVVYYDVKTFQDADTEEERSVPLLKHFTVFNVAQVDGLPESFEQTGVPYDPSAPSTPWEQGERAEALIAASGARIKGSGFRAYYSPAKDCIHLPARALFVDEASFYATLLHELAHWSGHPSRLNRQFGRRFGDAAYAMEELVAELTSAFLCAHCRIDGRLQHASYIASWLEVLQRDKRALFTAATQAQKVADLLIAPTVPAKAEALDERLALAA
jgi:antirestriction protein ArdC